MIRFKCPCGQVFGAADEHAGRITQCSACGRRLRIPAREPAAARRPEAKPRARPTARKATPRRPTAARLARAAARRPSARPRRPLRRRRPRQMVHSEAGAKRNLTVLGAMLLAGFLLPVIERRPDGSVRAAFVNIEALSSEVVSGLGKLLFAYPALAGVGVIVAAYAARGAGRAIALIAIAAVHHVVFVAGEEAGLGVSAIQLVGGADLLVVALLALLALMGMFAGSRALCFRIESAGTALLGAVSAGVLVLCLFLPVLPGVLGTLPVVVPFKLLEQEEIVLTGLGLLGGLGCLAAAAVLCLRNAGRAYRSLLQAQSAVVLIAVGVLTAQGGAFLDLARNTPAMDGPALLGLILLYVKVAVCWVDGMALVLPAGVTGLVLHLVPETPEEVATALPAAPVRPSRAPSPGPPVAPAASAPEDGRPAPAPQEAVQALPDPTAALHKLKALLDQGMITQADYARKKAELLSRL